MSDVARTLVETDDLLSRKLLRLRTAVKLIDMMSVARSEARLMIQHSISAIGTLTVSGRKVL